jgi:hypothetical protein
MENNRLRLSSCSQIVCVMLLHAIVSYSPENKLTLSSYAIVYDVVT